MEHRLQVSGLRNATVRFLPEPDSAGCVGMRTGTQVLCLTGDAAEFVEKRDGLGNNLETGLVSGDLFISW